MISLAVALLRLLEALVPRQPSPQRPVIDECPHDAPADTACLDCARRAQRVGLLRRRRQGGAA